MKVAIIGTGGIGRGYAAFLVQAGHEVKLWSPRGTPPHGEAGQGYLQVSGVVAGVYRPAVTSSCQQALADTDAVVVTITADGARSVIDEMVPHLNNDQTIIFSAHSSFSSLYLALRLRQRGVLATIVAWSTTVLTARRSGSQDAHISGLRAEVDMATLPACQGADGLAVCEALFGARFRLRDDVLAIQLSNLNPPVHMALMIGNLTRAERGEDWPNYGSITPAVGHIIEALDAERLALAAAFGLTVRSVQDHYVRSFGVEPGSMAAMAQAAFQKRPKLLGPKTLDTRFITEDVPFGLYPLECLGLLTGVATPLHAAGIELLSTACGREFRRENDLLPVLPFGGISVDELHRLVRDGP